MERPRPAQNTTGVASASASHSQPSNCSGGAMASSTSGAREDGGDDEPAPDRVGPIDRFARVRREFSVVPGRLDRVEQVGDGDALRIEAHRRLLGRVVDRRLDAVELVQLALDAVRARGARHALEREIDSRRGLVRHGLAHHAPLGSTPERSIPPVGI